MAEPPVTMMPAEKDGSEAPRPVQSDGANDTRSEHGTLARSKYDRLELEATEGGQANEGLARREDGHGATANREETGTKEEGEESPHRALAARDSNKGETEARVPPERLRVLNMCSRQEREGGGGTPPSSARSRHAVGALGGHTKTAARGPPARPGPGQRGVPPHTQERLQPARGQEGEGVQATCINRAQAEPGRKRGPLQTAACAPSTRYASEGQGDSPNQEEE